MHRNIKRTAIALFSILNFNLAFSIVFVNVVLGGGHIIDSIDQCQQGDNCTTTFNCQHGLIVLISEVYQLIIVRSLNGGHNSTFCEKLKLLF